MDSNASRNEQLYRAAIGDDKAAYYAPFFYRFDQPGASRSSWNWPAFFVTFPWLLYRRMYALAVGYVLVWPIVCALFFAAGGLLFQPAVAALLFWMVALGVQLIAVPLFANAAYHRHIRQQIEKLSVDTPQHDVLLQRLSSQSWTSATSASIGVACLGGIVALSAFAAVAIPEYQDRMVREQVFEGLVLAESAKASVARSYVTSGRWPTLGAREYREGSVSYIQVCDGAIYITYGNAANRLLAGRTLSLHPASTDGGEQVEWSCGYAASAAITQTDVAPKYLPSACRTPGMERL